MLKIDRRGLVFIIVNIFSCSATAFSAGNPSLDLEKIVVSKADSHVFNSYSLKDSDLKASPFNSPIEALNLSCVDLQGRAPKDGIQTDFSLRGSNFQGVLMLIDGQRINDPQTGHFNSDIPITSEDIEKIEVLPGIGSSLFGPDAIGGAIDIIRKKPKERKIILEAGYGQYKTWGGLLSVTEKIDDLGLRLSLENRESNGFHEDTDFKKFTASLSSSLDIPDGEFNFDLGYQEKEFGAFDFYTPGSNYPSKEWTKAWLLNTGMDLEKQGFLIKPGFLWRRHYDKFMLDKTFVRSRYLAHHRTDVYTPNIYFQKELAYIGKLGLGLEYGYEEIDSTTLNRHHRGHKSIFMDTSRDFNGQLSSGLSFRLDDFDGFGKVCTGSANFRYGLDEKNSLQLAISRSMRIPSFTELYYTDPTTIGNSGLSAESAVNYQAGYDYKKEALSLGALFFFRQENDLIDWIKRASSQAKWQAENISDDDVLGIESYFRLKMNNYIDLDCNYAYIDKLIDNQGFLYKYGPNYIKHLASGALVFNLPFGTETIGFTYKKKPGRSGWFLLDAHLAYKINKNAQVFLNSTNLLNVGYEEIVGIPQPGRWVEGGLRLEW